MTTQSPINVLICGGGNGAHVFSTLAASRKDVKVNVLTIYQNEAEKWTSAMSSKGNMTVTVGSKQVIAKPSIVTKSPQDVVPYADYIFIITPAYAHNDILTAIVESCRPETVLVALPGHPGFEYEYAAIFKEKVRQCLMVSFETLPWACRLRDYGTSSEIIGTKQMVSTSIWRGSDFKASTKSVLGKIQELIGEEPVLHLIDNLTCLTLSCKTIIHPPIIYAQWGNWDGLPLKNKPLFYQGVQDAHAELLAEVNDELIQVASAFERCPDLKWDMTEAKEPILEWYRKCYGNQIADDKDLKSALQTNSAYRGLTHPMKEVHPGEYEPDFTYRYTTEDVPYGLMVYKGLAEIVCVDTPAMDKIIAWAQTKLGHNYIQGSRLQDVIASRAPQRFNIKTVQELSQILHQYD